VFGDVALVDFDVGMDDIRQIKAGDDRRFNKILDKYSVLIDSVKRKYDAVGYDEDDFAQIVRISIWKAISAFDEGKIDDYSKVPNQLTKLVKKIIKRDIGSVFEKQTFQKRNNPTDEFDESQHPVNGTFDESLFYLEISRLFSGIREKIICFILQGYSQDEIAQKLGFPQKHISRQIQAMKKVVFC
jgi:RNA polymerase sigma factor (sigma-70 family)